MPRTAKLISDKERIEKIVSELRDIGVLPRLAGHCIAASDILQNMMNDYGIQARLVECKLAIYSQDESGGKRIYFVGYDGATDESDDTVDTHVVVITNSEKPILVDVSVGSLLPAGMSYIAEYIDSVDPEVMAKFIYGDTTLIYRPKQRTRYPYIHQKTLIERIRSEASIKQTIHLMRILIVACFALGAINMFLNLTNISMKMLQQW